ncbi:hypothetical protein [Kaarinaea lacus]
MQVKCKFFLVLIALVIIALSGCSSTPKEADESAVQEQQQQAAKTESVAPEVDSAKTETATESADAEEAVQVLEPKMAEQPELKLEPIPEKTVADEADKKAVDVTEITTETPSTDATAKKEDQLAKATPAVAAPEATDDSKKTSAEVPVSSGPQHFVITVNEKDSSHPFFGKGHTMGFLINGNAGGEVVVERGKSYRFDVSTDPKHDVYFSKKDIGWGASPWSEGVEGAYVYQGTINFKPTENTPEVLYYSCRNHPYMGGKIHVINPGEKIQLTKRAPTASATATTSKKAPQAEVSVAMVNQKIMFVDMLLKSSSSKRVTSSNNDEAKAMQANAEKLASSAKEKLKSGDNQVAYANAEEALSLLKQAARLVPSEEEAAELKERHSELKTSLANFEQSHEENYKRIVKTKGEAAAVDYDKTQVASLKTQSDELAKKGDYVNANKSLEKAQHMITEAIQKMLHAQTIVYDLNFETPQEEYEYELKRFVGYEELIPVAVEQKKPKEGAKKLMETYWKKGQQMRDAAVQKAEAGEWSVAIAMLQDATKEVRRALRMVGVMQ